MITVVFSLYVFLQFATYRYFKISITFVQYLRFSPVFKTDSQNAKTSSKDTVLGRFSLPEKRKNLPAETPQTGCF
jgi:hypothetical protein